MTMKEISRNDPCSCGSGKKYKKCCGAAAAQSAQGQTAKSGSPDFNATNVPPPSESLLKAVALHQAGQLDEAKAAYQSLLKNNPDDSDALHYLGLIAFQRGDYPDAAGLIEQAIKLNGNIPAFHFNLGNAYRQLKQLDSAINAYLESVRLDPRFLKAHFNLGNTFKEQGKLEAAVEHYRKALALKPDYAEAHTNLGIALNDLCEFGAAAGSFINALKLTETQEIKDGFARCLEYVYFTRDDADARHFVMRAMSEPWGRPSLFVGASVSLINLNRNIKECIGRAAKAWPTRLPRQKLFGPSGLASVADDQLLKCLLENAPVCDIKLERFLSMARLALLDAATQAVVSGVPEKRVLTFYCALARQCFINEYVFSHTGEELGQAQLLRERLVEVLASGLTVPVLWLVAVAAYFPLISLPSIETLPDQSWPEPVAALLQQQVLEPLEERQLRTGIPSLTTVEDEVSRLVRQQYEENPYPRWIKSPLGGKTTTVDDFLHRQFPLVTFQPLGKSDEIDILIAGCGTGQHPIQTAQQFRGARVLAVDLSLASLSYAKRKTRELGLGNIEYAQADIMKLETIGRTFDVIESVGVLHHMADPMAGWRNLVSLLRPGGFMHLGFYSELARQHIVAARGFIAKQGYVASAVDIRQFRQDIMAMNTGLEEIKKVMSTPDFFTTSACRDLLFHVHEHRFTLPQIKECLGKLGLDFIGLSGLDPYTIKQYLERFPDDKAMSNIDLWSIFETEATNTFASMYQFWVQKRGMLAR